MSDVRAPAGAVEVVLEVRRHGRRPRYHRGARVDGNLTKPEQCNTDQAGLGTRQLEGLPPTARPNQLCRRCWRNTLILAAADALTAST